MRGPAARPVVIAAGGTGGHFFPAEALATELVSRGHRVVLMTDARSAGLSSAIFTGRETYVLSGAGIAGRGVWRAAKALLSLAAGVIQARRILAQIRPATVVGFGGYPCVAPILAARSLRRRPAIMLHEQNAVLGRANRFLARLADLLALGFDNTQRVPNGTQTMVTGNPVRPAISALTDTGYAQAADRIRLLVLGGSLGARVFSDVVPPALISLPPALRDRLSVTQQARPEDLERVKAAYAAAGIAAELAPFFPDVAAHLAQAHLVIARAGASTVAELAVAGRPSILVPLPGAIDDHQSENARTLAEAGGAWVVPQAEFTSEALSQRLSRLFQCGSALTHAAAKARGLARTDAACLLAGLVERQATMASAGERL